MDKSKKEIRHAFTVPYEKISPELLTKVSFSSSFKNANAIEVTGIGIWDTGATTSAISSNIAKKCNLIPISKAEVHTAGGLVSQNVYLVDILVPNGVVINSVKVTEIPEIHGADALIGMDVIQLGDFAISNTDGKTTFTFRIPSCKKYDFVEDIDNYNRQIAKKNHQLHLYEEKKNGKKKCPCGSGRPYRYCCGKKETQKS